MERSRTTIGAMPRMPACWWDCPTTARANSDAGDTWMEEDDVRYLGVQHETTARAILFDSRRLLHGTMPWTGNRCVLIA